MSNATKNSEETPRVGVDASIASYEKVIGNDSNIMALTSHISPPGVAKIIQENQDVMLLKYNLMIKSLMVTLNTSARKVPSRTLESLENDNDLVKQVSPPSLNSKLSPEALICVPKSVIAKKNESRTLESIFSPANAYTINFGENYFDEDKEHNMMDTWFDRVVREEDISPRQQRSGRNKSKKEDTWKVTYLRR
ncbi:hypothetical protein H5410_035731 [Solanum commersonii]|uniref:Uncharacterized protein n=1 Tax=Solanum commersonii TaxID=4109 RepID=A0A9J5Y1I1_SOLCO|nr:hypothetical protein H5410_035731 [Solanum commersonii]